MLPALVALLVVAGPASPSGEVKLPLRDYLAMVEKAEAAERAAAEARDRTEPSIAEVVSQRTSLVLEESGADVTSTYDVELRGTPLRPVPLPLAGLADRIRVEPPGIAAVGLAGPTPTLVAPSAGRYRVSVSGRAPVASEGGIASVGLAPMVAPVSELEVNLPAGRQWRCGGATVVDDASREGRRLVRLALPRGQAARFEMRREVAGGEGEKALANAVVVTIIELKRDGPRRHDIVLYELARGGLGRLALTLPEGLEPERAATDEGDVPPILEGRTLRTERRRTLTATGYLVVTSEPPAAAEIALAPVVPEVKVRARYLALADSVAAEVEPRPAAGWARVDLGDLPAAVGREIASLDLTAAWRLKDEGVAASLGVSLLPRAQQLPALVALRDSTTLLTFEGTVVHRDEMTVEGRAAALDLRLPPDGVLWSVQVDGVAVRPLEKEGLVSVPLGFGARASSTVEVVVVQERSIPEGRSRLDLALPEVVAPVLEHRWRLLLPEDHRYRFASGGLTPAPAGAGAEAAAGFSTAGMRGRSVATGPGGSASIRGKVLDESGAVIPGAAVRVTSPSLPDPLHAVSDDEGRFLFAALPGGRYTLDASLSGFQSAHYPDVRLSAGQAPAYALQLRVASVSETITVNGVPPLLSGLGAAAPPAEPFQDYKAQAAQLKQGLVGGVKPVPVSIPESGKLLFLAGALPPARVGVQLEVKGR